MSKPVKYTKQVREDAAQLLSVLASQGEPWQLYIMDVAGSDTESPTSELMGAAYRYVSDAEDADPGIFISWREHYAEAEALIRDGWLPEPETH